MAFTEIDDLGRNFYSSQTAIFCIWDGDGDDWNMPDWIYLGLRDCQLHNTRIAFCTGDWGMDLFNNLFERCQVQAFGDGCWYDVQNNLFWNSSPYMVFNDQTDNAYGQLLNNLFDSCSLYITGNQGQMNNNGYINTQVPSNETAPVYPAVADYQVGPLGNRYYPTSGTGLFRLINAGSTTADVVGEYGNWNGPVNIQIVTGLYHYTTQTNQMIEGDSVVDIGFHYVALDAYGNPLDTNGDGIPDYLEDANGNGIFDAGDLGDWQISPFGLGGANDLQVFTPLK
jgi:hypothetical protein